jgi:hypothetical protein
MSSPLVRVGHAHKKRLPLEVGEGAKRSAAERAQYIN